MQKTWRAQVEDLQTTTARPSEGVLCHVCQVCQVLCCHVCQVQSFGMALASCHVCQVASPTRHCSLQFNVQHLGDIGQCFQTLLTVLKQRGRREESGRGNAQVTQVNQFIQFRKLFDWFFLKLLEMVQMSQERVQIIFRRWRGEKMWSWTDCLFDSKTWSCHLFSRHQIWASLASTCYVAKPGFAIFFLCTRFKLC